MRRLNLRGLTAPEQPIAHGAIISIVANNVRSHVRDRFASGGLLPPVSFGAVVAAMRELSQEARAFLNRFSAQRQAAIADLSNEARSDLALQKETVATAMMIAGLDRTPLQMWSPTGTVSRQSFLDGLPQFRSLEDQMVINDLTNFPGFGLLETRPHGAAIFTGDSGVRLTVVVANKLPLEEQLGADLIYCSETFRSFVVVQYKAMAHEAGEDRFRLPSEQLTKELERMDATWVELQKCATTL